jgi:O-antigen/teichoic acid export membrane protein
MTQFHRSAIHSFVNRYTVTALNVVMTAVLSRILSPSEIGVFILGTGAVALVETLRDFGIGSYLVQEPGITPAGIGTTFTILLATSIIFTAAVDVAAAPLARFYGDDRLGPALQVIAFGFLAGPFTSPRMALLRRHMQFAIIAKIEIIAAIVNFAAAICLALSGAGFMTLAWASLLSTLSVSVCVTLLSPAPLLLHFSLQEWRKIAAFGWYSSATGFVNILFLQLPQLILGRLISLDAVAMFNRAGTICQLPDRMILGIFQPLLLPAISHEVRNGNNLRALYLRSASNLAAVLWPALISLALLAEPIVHILLGPNWSEVVPLVRWISIASLALFPTSLTYPLLVALDRVRDTLVLSLISLPISIAIICGACFVGTEAVAASLILANAVIMIVAFIFIQKYVAITWADLARATLKSGLVTLCTILPAAAIVLVGPHLSSIPALFVCVATVGFWLVALRITDHRLLRDFRDLPILSRMSASAPRPDVTVPTAAIESEAPDDRVSLGPRTSVALVRSPLG